MKTSTIALKLSLLALLTVPCASFANTVVINFDSPSPGSPGLDPTLYLASFGVTLSGVSPSNPLIYSDLAFYGSGVVQASSGHNFLLQQSAVNGGSFTLNFNTGLSQLGFTRIANRTNNSVGSWTATAYSGATAVGSFGESYGLGAFSPATYTYTGSNITSLTVSGNGFGSAGISSLMMDNLTLTSVPDGGSSLLLIGGALAMMVLARSRRGRV